MFVVVLMVLLAVIFCGTLSVLADDGENLKKAGQQALQERDGVLTEKKTALEMFVQQAAEDRVISVSEMITLRNMVYDFDSTKRTFDEELKIYSLKTTVEEKEGCTRVVDIYFGSNVLFKEDPNGDIRKFFAAESGFDVKVQRGAVFDYGVSVFTRFGSFFLLVCIFSVLVAVFSKKERASGIAGAIIFFILTMAMLIIILAI